MLKDNSIHKNEVFCIQCSEVSQACGFSVLHNMRATRSYTSEAVIQRLTPFSNAHAKLVFTVQYMTQGLVNFCHAGRLLAAIEIYIGLT